MPSRPDDPTVAPERARALIEATFPELHPVRLGHLGRGWDHEVFLVNDAWVFRFPRNAAAAAALETELVLLPWLAPRLPTPIPEPTLSGVLDPDSGWRFAGHRLLPGSTVCDTGADERTRAALAPALGRFVRALHAVKPDSMPVALGPDPLERLDFARRGPFSREKLTAWRDEGELPGDAVARLLRMLDDCPPEPEGEPRVIVHADLHARNLLIDDSGTLAGVIDWVDVHAGERSVDLAAAFEVLPPRARETFFAEYGAIPRETMARARWRAIDHLTRTVAGCLERGDPLFARVARNALLETSEV